MSLRNIGIVYRKELTESLRDRRTLISTIVVPLLFFPVLFTGFGYMASNLIGKAQKESPKIMILGGEDSPQVIAAIQKVDDPKKLDPIEIVPASQDYENQITDKKIRAAVEIPPGFQTALEKGEAPAVKIHMYENEIKSEISAKRIEKSLEKYRDQVVQDRLSAKNLPASTLKPFAIEQHNV